MPTIDLKCLQATVASDFEAWVVATSREEALDARKRVYEAVKTAIPSRELNGRGLYCFARLAEPNGIGRIVYVGIVSHGAHTLAKRMWDHLAKECSSLRPGLCQINEEEAERDIKALLALLHPADKTEKYAITHLKGRRMSRGDTIFLYPVDASSQTIEEAETALIRAARPHAGERHELVNSKKMKSSEPISKEGLSLARRAIEAWDAEGIGNVTAQRWLNRLAAIDKSEPFH